MKQYECPNVLRNETWAHCVWLVVQAVNRTTPGAAIQIIIHIVQCTTCLAVHINPVAAENVEEPRKVLGRGGKVSELRSHGF